MMSESSSQKEPRRQSDLPEDRLTQRRADYDVHELTCFTHRLDTRISVVEVRMEAQDARLASIEKNVGETRNGVERMLECLHEHVQQEAKDRIRLMAAVISTLIAALISLAMTIVNKGA